MSKWIAFIMLIATSSFGQAAYDGRFEAGRHANGALYWWIECPVAVLTNEIPVEAKWATRTEPAPDGSTNTVQVAKTLDEYVLKKDLSLDGTTVMILLAAMERPTVRNRPVNEADLTAWEYYLTPFGYAQTNWFTTPVWRSKVASPAYLEGITQ